MFSIDNIIFSIGGQGISLLEFIAVLSGLLCVFCATRGKVLNFWVGYLYNVLLFVMFMQKHLYSSMLLQPISLIINFFGHYRWTHPRQNEKNKREELKVSLLTNKGRAGLIALVALFALCWGLFLSKLNVWWPETFPVARQPFLDAFITGFILLAQYLSAQKKIECWLCWFIVNVSNIILYIRAGLAFMPIVAACYIILAFFGFSMWRKELREQNSAGLE